MGNSLSSAEVNIEGVYDGAQNVLLVGIILGIGYCIYLIYTWTNNIFSFGENSFDENIKKIMEGLGLRKKEEEKKKEEDKKEDKKKDKSKVTSETIDNISKGPTCNKHTKTEEDKLITNTTKLPEEDKNITEFLGLGLGLLGLTSGTSKKTTVDDVLDKPKEEKKYKIVDSKPSLVTTSETIKVGSGLRNIQEKTTGTTSKRVGTRPSLGLKSSSRTSPGLSYSLGLKSSGDTSISDINF